MSKEKTKIIIGDAPIGDYLALLHERQRRLVVCNNDTMTGQLIGGKNERK